MIGKSKFAMTFTLMAAIMLCFSGVAVCDSADATDVVGSDDPFAVTYVMDGETVKTDDAIQGEDGKYTATVLGPADLGIEVPEGKELVWKDADGSIVEIGSVLIAETTLTASIEALPAYAVTFVDVDEVTEIAKFVCFEGSTPVAPEAPAKDGMTFKGWSINGVDVIEIPTVTADATYVAVYEVNMYTVTFMDGDRVVYTFEIEHGKTITDVPAGFDWDFDFTAPITGDVTINPVVEVEPEPEPAPAEPEDNSTTYALLAVLAIIVVVGLFVAVWYIKKEKD